MLSDVLGRYYKLVSKQRGNVNTSKHITLCVKHGRGSVIPWACMAPNGTGSLVFIDYVAAVNSTLFTFGQMLQTERAAYHILQKQQTIVWEQRMKYSTAACSCLNPGVLAFQLLKTELKAESPTSRHQLRLQPGKASPGRRLGEFALLWCLLNVM